MLNTFWLLCTCPEGSKGCRVSSYRIGVLKTIKEAFRSFYLQNGLEIQVVLWDAVSRADSER